MKNIYLLKYSVKGIKTLDELVSLSFYKKIISIRKSYSCLRTVNIIPLVCKKMIYGYLCQSENQQIYVLMNGT